MQPPLPSEPGGVSAVTREEQGIVGGRPPLQHEGNGEKQRSHNPLGRIKPQRESFCWTWTSSASRGFLLGRCFSLARARTFIQREDTFRKNTKQFS